MDGDKPRIGVVGAGYWGPNVIRNFVELPDAWVVAVADSNPANLARTITRYPLITHATQDYTDLLHLGLDAVVVCTPAQTHCEIAGACLAAGLHVLVEKPLATSSADARQLIDLAQRNQRILMVGHLLEYHPGVHKLREIADAGELGEIYYVYSKRLNLGQIRGEENALWSLGAHDVSVVLHLLGGEEPEEVLAHGESFMQFGVEDVVFCYLRFPSGRVAHMHLSWLDPHKMRKITVVGREKMVVFDDMELERKVTVYEKGPWKPVERYGEWQTRTGDIHSPRIPNDEPLKLECQAFLELVEGDGDPGQVARDGAMVVRALERLTDSLRG